MTANIKQHVVPRSRQPIVSSGRVFVTTRSYQRGTGQRARSYQQQGSVSHGTITIVFGVLAVAMVGMLGFVYLKQVVNTASHGTDVHALESRIIDLNERQRQLELEGAQLRSLQAVENNVQKLNLVSTDRVSYLTTVPGQVAAAR